MKPAVAPPQDPESADPADPPLTAELIVHGYLQGAFPMADHADGPIHWYSPDPRAVLPIRPDDPWGQFHIPRSLAKAIRKTDLVLTRDADFAGVITGCAQPRPGDDGGTWINPEIITAYTDLHRHGLAGSVEAWRDGRLVGGVYGVCLNGAFFAESMFSREPNASKICLVHLVSHLKQQGFILLDVQFHNPHLEQFGVVEVPRDEYLALMESAVELDTHWSIST